MDYKKDLYYARIKKIEFINFRNIEYGTVEFPNSNIEDYAEEKTSILGLYGQNGSGKTSVIMALGILKDVLSGVPLSNKYESCIRKGCERCSLKVSFSLLEKLTDSNNRPIMEQSYSQRHEAFYDFDIVLADSDSDGFGDTQFSAKNKYLKIENEVFKFRSSNGFGNTFFPKQTVFDTRVNNETGKQKIFGSKWRENAYTNGDKEVLVQFKEIMAVTSSSSQSFIFSPRTLNLLISSIGKLFAEDEDVINANMKVYNAVMDAINGEDFQNKAMDLSEEEISNIAASALLVTPLNLISNLRTFGNGYLHVIDTIITGQTNINTKMPLLLWKRGIDSTYSYEISLLMDGPTSVNKKIYENVKSSLRDVSDVLEKIVPGLKLNIVELGSSLSIDNEEQCNFEVISEREGTSIPLKYESDGVRRIVSILSLLIAAYNDSSFTIAIDEIDSGIFEYLLGELLGIMQDNIKGQLVFTSHNLRPLEVLEPRYLCFTTTEPNNRFIRIANRGNSNLRDGYIRSIILNTQKEAVYNPTDRYEIELAFYKAGHSGVEK